MERCCSSFYTEPNLLWNTSPLVNFTVLDMFVSLIWFKSLSYWWKCFWLISNISITTKKRSREWKQQRFYLITPTLSLVLMGADTVFDRTKLSMIKLIKVLRMETNEEIQSAYALEYMLKPVFLLICHGILLSVGVWLTKRWYRVSYNCMLTKCGLSYMNFLCRKGR